MWATVVLNSQYALAHLNMTTASFKFLRLKLAVSRFDLCFRLRNDLYCVEWDVKLYSLTHWCIL